MKGKRKRKITVKDIIRLIVLLVACAVLLYPTYSSYLNEKNGSKAILFQRQKQKLMNGMKVY